MNTLPTLRVVSRTLAVAIRRRITRKIEGKTRLRVGVDIRAFYEPLTGIGWYLFHVLEELGRRDDLELVLFGDARMTDEGPLLHASIPDSSHYAVFDLRGITPSRFSRSLTAGAFLALIWIEGCDLIFAPNYFLPRLMDSVARRRVITIHDLTYRRHPDLLQKETLDNLGREMDRAVAQADAIITVSEATRRDLLELYDLDPSRTHAILSGASLADSRGHSTHDLPALLDGVESYVLFVSTIEPRKNLDVLVEAFDRIADDGWPGHLVVVGKVGWKSEATMERMRRARHAHRIRHLDYVERDELAALYEKSAVYVMPSLYEGFGLPILEAMAMGTPVIAAGASSLPEVGGDAARYFSPDDPEQLARILVDMLGNEEERNRLIEAGLRRVENFNWTDTASKTFEVFRRCAAGKLT